MVNNIIILQQFLVHAQKAGNALVAAIGFCTRLSTDPVEERGLLC